ncbi:hypothetical protein L9F63_019569 [Diploptera punctata]|uniref:Endonuclease-reverse transcriptase n=1 Tax=Diploptera punctata TaxID=6984 RepID=A0AAD7ZW11_DIPPU|nr:hypothetical protein L9F63_019569 [Diploptera punctata]
MILISLEEQIKYRLVNGNKAYFANRTLFKSKLISKTAKIRLYKTLIRPVVTYACETWVLKETIKQKLLIFERKFLRRIFGPNRGTDNYRRIKTNNELNKLIKNQNIVNHIRSLRIGWLGHLIRMDDQRLVKRLYTWKPIGDRDVGRPEIRWEDDTMNDLRKIKVTNLNVARDRLAWRRIVEKAKTFTSEVVVP